MTEGPSIVSQGVDAVALPGNCNFNCVPIAANESRINIVEGCNDIDAKPAVLERP